MNKIAITRGLFILVDDDDLELVRRHSWSASLNRDRRTYVKAYVSGKVVYLHRLLLNAAPGQVVDHISGDPLDNRRSNLRLCSQQDNRRNSIKRRDRCTSEYKGVVLVPGRVAKPWRMNITFNGKQSYEFYATEIDAARAYDTAAKQFFGSFARINFPVNQQNVAPSLVCETYKQEALSCALSESVFGLRQTV